MVRPKHQALLLLLALFWFSPCGAGMADTLIETVDSSYQPDPAALTVLQQIDQPVTILLFYGVWCPDSQREIPRFRRILELVENPYIILDGYEVDRKKQDESGKADEFGIKFVPTFIVMQKGLELGRIVETPQLSLEEDLAKMFMDKQ